MSTEQTCFSIIKGDSWTRTIYFTDDDGSPIDITGWKIYLMVKSKIDDLDAAAVISKTVTTFTNPTSGEAELELTSTDTNLVGSYLYGIKVITSNMIGITHEAITVLSGIMNFSDRVVQAIS